MQLLKWFSLMKEVVMCNKNLRLKSPLKVNRPFYIFILTLPFYGGGGGGVILILNLILRMVGCKLCLESQGGW